VGSEYSWQHQRRPFLPKERLKTELTREFSREKKVKSDAVQNGRSSGCIDFKTLSSARGRMESRTRSTEQTVRRPQAVVHESSV
jgi:hypothetical protein